MEEIRFRQVNEAYDSMRLMELEDEMDPCEECGETLECDCNLHIPERMDPFYNDLP